MKRSLKVALTAVILLPVPMFAQNVPAKVSNQPAKVKKNTPPQVPDLYYFALVDNHRNFAGKSVNIDTASLATAYMQDVADEDIRKFDEFDKRRKIKEYKDKLVSGANSVNYETEYTANFTLDNIGQYDFSTKSLSGSSRKDFTIDTYPDRQNPMQYVPGYLEIVFLNSHEDNRSFNIPLNETDAEMVVKKMRGGPEYKIMGLKHFRFTRLIMDGRQHSYLMAKILTVEYYLVKVDYDENGKALYKPINKLAEVAWPDKDFPHTDIY